MFFLKEHPKCVEKHNKILNEIDIEISKNNVYLFFESFVKATFLDLIAQYINKSEESILEKIYRYAEFFEEMAQSRDEKVVAVLSIAIFENISYDDKLLNQIYKVLPLKSKKLFLETNKFIISIEKQN